MKLSIQKWGNSASVRLPAALLEQMGAVVGSALEVSITKEGLLLKPERRPHYKLTDLLAEMPAGKLPSVEGWDEMPVVGQETL
ncbi:AbrB/MazE/SpoVT family DNA-binding domain-containing protein [Methylobacillus gramineus]|uniref:AbrB/MazE/SpoVT family DNA-binding domain-containing protein n=1 Tax=Methylobacillus gramineus TaxID=755169 RepID=UPI001CFF6C61|nr:AbrB/MazE/SpoVT family DNA-binding domain-containing protein [Methylobacillus gramineus]MCB5184226.1 AbrB/MazE/SpoVT family DNA-binding domain-containing protein [Methylobacillus gramineus]